MLFRLLTTQTRGVLAVYPIAVHTIIPGVGNDIELKKTACVLLCASRHGYVRLDAARITGTPLKKGCGVTLVSSCVLRILLLTLLYTRGDEPFWVNVPFFLKKRLFSYRCAIK
ncbi:hypothetical protein TNCV_1007481 [Trichonephila clavipes]|nr:hypothetical protein TNCV_1007481 [Trichonephila clavipes]